MMKKWILALSARLSAIWGAFTAKKFVFIKLSNTEDKSKGDIQIISVGTSKKNAGYILKDQASKILYGRSKVKRIGF